MLNFTVENQKLNRADLFYTVSGSQEYLTATFNFKTEDWDDKTKTAVFKDTGDTAYCVLLDDNNGVTIPSEVLQGEFFDISVFGTKNNTRITTNPIKIYCEKCGYTEGKAPADPTPDIYTLILEKVQNAEKIAQGVEDKANNGEFNGKDGQNGQNGADGQDGNGIEKIEKISTAGLTDTYRIYFTNGKTYDYEVNNGKKGEQGEQGTTNYTDLENKPSINGVALEGNKNLKDLGILNTFHISAAEQFIEIYEKIASGDVSMLPCILFILTDTLEESTGFKQDSIVLLYTNDGELRVLISSITNENFTTTYKDRIDAFGSFKYNYEKYHTNFGLIEKTDNVYNKINSSNGTFLFDNVKPNHFILNVEISVGTQTVIIYHNDKTLNNTFDVSPLSENETVLGTIEMFKTEYTEKSGRTNKGVYAKATFRNSKGELNLYSDVASYLVNNTPNIEVGNGVRVISAYGKQD